RPTPHFSPLSLHDALPISDPIRRGNTNDNTPAVLHTRLVPGNQIHLMVAPKGFGSENMSRTIMLTPSATREQIIGAVVETARLADRKSTRLNSSHVSISYA